MDFINRARADAFCVCVSIMSPWINQGAISIFTTKIAVNTGPLPGSLLVNLQYSLFIVRGELTADGLLRIAIQDNLIPDTDGFFIHDIARHNWIGLIGASLDGYDTSREAFLGPYRGYYNPLVVERGLSSNSYAYGDNACGSLVTNQSLQPGETREILVLLGIGDARTVGKRTIVEFGSLERAEDELQELKKNDGTPNWIV